MTDEIKRVVERLRIMAITPLEREAAALIERLAAERDAAEIGAKHARDTLIAAEAKNAKLRDLLLEHREVFANCPACTDRVARIDALLNGGSNDCPDASANADVQRLSPRDSHRRGHVETE